MNQYKMLKYPAFVALAIAVGSSKASAGIDLGTFDASGSSSPSDQKPYAASVSFEDLGGGQLQVTLVNTYTGATFGIGDTIYGLYFAGADITSEVSAEAPTGSTVWNYDNSTKTYTKSTLTTPQNISNDGANWQNSTLNTGSGTEAGVSAIGSGNQSYGLLSEGFAGNFSTDGLKNANHNPYVQDSAVFILDYSGSISSISGVEFLYGTDASQSDTVGGTLVVVPEPMATGKLAGFSVLGLLLFTVRRKFTAGA